MFTSLKVGCVLRNCNTQPFFYYHFSKCTTIKDAKTEKNNQKVIQQEKYVIVMQNNF
jgi:hypothetical protein